MADNTSMPENHSGFRCDRSALGRLKLTSDSFTGRGFGLLKPAQVRRVRRKVNLSRRGDELVNPIRESFIRVEKPAATAESDLPPHESRHLIRVQLRTTLHWVERVK